LYFIEKFSFPDFKRRALQIIDHTSFQLSDKLQTSIVRFFLLDIDLITNLKRLYEVISLINN